MNPSIQQYHADIHNVSKSQLDIIARDPFEYYLKKINPDAAPPHVRQEWAKDQDKRHFVVGDALDRLLLQPHLFQQDFFVTDNLDRRTKSGKQDFLDTCLANQGKRWLSPDEHRDIKNMVAAIKRSPYAIFVEPSRSQETVYWNDPSTGQPCKCRPDWLIDLTEPRDNPIGSEYDSTELWQFLSYQYDEIIFDLKSISKISAFSSHVADFRYDVQNAFYFDGVNTNRDDGKRRLFAFMVVDVEWPHPVMVRTLPSEAIRIGRAKYQQDIDTLQRCRATGEWPMANTDWQETVMPSWYLFQNRNL